MAGEVELERIGVYCILNEKTRKVYVGSASRSLRLRWNDHQNCLRRGCHFNKHLQASWDRYGSSSFRFIILKNCSSEDCLKWEQKFLDYFDASNPQFGYNSRPIADSNRGKKFGPMSAEHRAKISASGGNRKGSKHSKETRQRLSLIQKGKKKSKSFCDNLRRVRTGWKFSEESKEKMRQSAIKRGISEVTRMKIAATKRTPKSHLKSSVSAKRRGISEETKRKISATLMGQSLSEEHRKKLSLAAKAQWERIRS